MTTISFPHNCPYSGNRPYADVILVPSFPGAPTHKCLVDSGADYLQLPASAASSVGISLIGATPTSVSTVAGATTLQLVTGVQVDIEGYTVTVDVLFDPTNTSHAIAGRQLLLAAFDIGFNSSDWLWT
jgi:predicted aspartyl protease